MSRLLRGVGRSLLNSGSLPPPLPAPRAAYPYDQFTGGLNDYSGNGFDMTLVSGSTFYGTAKYVRGLSIPTSQVKTSAPPMSGALATASFTISAWVQFQGVAGEFGLDDGAGAAAAVISYAAGNIVAKFDAAHTPVTITTTAPSDENAGGAGVKWHLFTVTVDSGTAKLYVDGVLAGSADVSGTSCSIANAYATNVSLIDDFMVLASALEVRNVQKVTNSPVAYLSAVGS